MALTKIRGSQIQDHSIGNAHIDPTSPIVYTNLDLSNSIVATDLSADHTVHTDVLDYKLIALWDMVQSYAVSGTSVTPTAQIQAAAVTDTASNDGSAKGVLTTGTGVNGVGTENYKVQIRNALTKDPIDDGLGGSVYGQLSYSGSDYTLGFYKSDASAFTMGLKETVSITALDNTNDALLNHYFVITSPSALYAVKFIHSGDTQVAVTGYTTIYATVANNDTATTVAQAIATALNGITGVFTATASSAVVSVSIVAGEVIQGVADGAGILETGFTFSRTQKGTPASIDFMFEEIYSLNSAPLKGFVTGTGFTDVESVTGTHNHNDLYYTKAELESGQLDDRYYTQSELNAGQLDNRYFTESELLNGAVDSRYYTETELGSNASGSSGADKIGISGVTNLSAGTVQGAFAEIQSDIDNIVSGGLDIDHSLDDAYDDGSAISVDNTNVTWTLASTKSFKIADGADANKFAITAGTAADSVKVATTGGVDIDASAGLDVQDGTSGDEISLKSGTLQLASATSTVLSSATDVQVSAAAGAINISATAGTAAHAIDIKSVAGGIEVAGAKAVDVVAGTDVTLKDQYLTAAIPLSQANATALDSHFAVSSQTGFDWSARGTGTAAIASLVGAVNANRSDLYEYVELLNTKGAAIGVAAGANLVGVDGITGVIPTGKTLGADATLQEMLEGIAMGAGGGKTYDTLSAFTTAKAGGTYFKLNEPIFILDTNRWIIVKVQGTTVVEGTDWDYVAGDNRVIGGSDYKVAVSDDINLTATDVLSLTGTASASLTGDGAVLALDKTASLTSATGSKLTITSDTESEINGGALVDINGDVVTIDGATSITAPVNTAISETTTGTGQITLASEQGINANGGNINLTAGTGKQVNITSDTLVLVGSTTKVEITSNTIDVNGSVDVDGATFNVATTDTTASSIQLNSAGGIDVDAASGINISENSGSSLVLDDTGNVSLTSPKIVTINGTNSIVGTATNGYIGLYSSTSTDLQSIYLQSSKGGIYLEAGDATGGNVNVVAGADLVLSSKNLYATGIITETATADKNITLTTSGIGQVVINSEKELNVNAPYTSIAGDVTMPVDSWLSVGNIKITSVDPTDEATITGSRAGTVSALNKLVNSGFESGTGEVADNWTLPKSATRTQLNRYYGSYSIKFVSSALAADEAILTQATTGLTASTAHTVSFYIFGSTGGSLKVSLNGGAAKVIDTAKTYSSWTRVSVTLDADNTAAGNFIITATGTGAEVYNCYIDAVMVEQNSTASDYFTDYKSELVMTIGDNDDDRMVFRSVGTATKDLVRINQANVEILGNLVVSGTTTQVSSETVNIADNTLTLNSNVTGTPSLDAFLKVNRGSSAATAIRWNESSDEWEVTNDGTNYSAIVTSSGTGGLGLSLDSAYNGGSAVSVDNTDVNFTLADSKSFIISDSTDANKFEISAGSGASSIKIDTTGGVDIDTDAGFMVDDDSGSHIYIMDTGAISINSGTNFNIGIQTQGTGSASFGSTYGQTAIRSTNSTSISAVVIDSMAGGIDINAEATKPINIDSGSFSIDSVLASNIDVTGANLTVGTLTSGDLLLSSAGAITGTAGTDKAISFTASGTGKASLVSAQEVDLTGGDIVLASGTGKQITETSNTAINLNGGATVALTATTLDLNGQMDFDGGTFDVNATGTTASAVKIVSAGGVDIQTVGMFRVTQNGSSYINMNSEGDITLQSNTDHQVYLTTSNDTSSLTIANGTVGISANGNGDGYAITIGSTGGDVMVGVGATKTLYLNGGKVSANATLASNVSVTGANLTLSTITSGALALSSAGELTFGDSRLSGITFTDSAHTALPGSATSIVGAFNALYNELQAANTFNEIYDGETGDRVVTVDNGSVLWNITSGYRFAVQDANSVNILSAASTAGGNAVTLNGTYAQTGASATYTLTGTGADSFKIDTTGGVDIDTDAGFAVNDDSGAYLTLSSAGALALVTATNQDLVATAAGTGNVTISSAAGKVAITSNSTASDSIKINAAAGGIQIASAFDMSTSITTTGAGQASIASAQEIDLTGGVIDINGGNNSNVTIDAIGTGKVLINSADAFAIAGGAASEIKTTLGNLTVHATGSGYNLVLGDARTGDISFSDASHSALPNGASSLLAAIQAAYDNKGTEVSRAYQEITATSTDVSNDYVVTNVSLFPSTGTFPMSPSALRALTAQVHAVVYLNGLRLSDTEWTYTYDSGTSERRIAFNGSDNITLVSGDLIMVDVEYISDVTA